MIILLKIAFEPKLIEMLGPGRERIANIVILFLAIGSVSWLTMARVIRGQVLSLKAQPYLEAARAGYEVVLVEKEEQLGGHLRNCARPEPGTCS